MTKLYNKALLIAFTLFAISYFSIAQNLPSASPESVQMSSERLAKLDALVNDYVNKEWVPGGVFLVARHGKVVYKKSFGHRTVDKKNPYQNDDIFRIASMTKAITVASIMQLYEQGKIGIDDPIHYYIQGYKDAQVLDTFNESDSTYTTVPAEKAITIRHLLTHTSGITYGAFNPGKLMAIYEQHEMNAVGLSHETWSTTEFIDRLAKIPLAFQPGEKFLYGLNIDVLGRIIEVVSGVTLSEYFQKNIFTPLGMKDTFFYLPKDRHKRLAPLYSPSKEGGFIMAAASGLAPDIDYPNSKGRDHYAGGGGLSSTADDYAIFIQALLNYGKMNGNRILGRKTIEMMTSDQLAVQNSEGKGISKSPGVTFNLGYLLTTDEANGANSKSPGTYEWGGYFNTKFFIDPTEDLIFVGMTQIVPFPHGEFWDRMYAIIYGSIDD